MKSEDRILAAEGLKLFLRETLDDLRIRMGAVKKKYKMTWDEVKEHHLVRNPDIVESIRMAEDDVDNDIIGRVLSGNATEEECETWKQDVVVWHNLILASLSMFEESAALSEVA